MATILLAEHVLKIVPAGTHDYEKYLEVERCLSLLKSNGISVTSLKGLALDPFGKWHLHERPFSDSLLMNYILCGQKIV